MMPSVWLFGLRLQLDRLQVRERALLLAVLVLAFATATYGIGQYSGLTDHQAQREQIERLSRTLDANEEALATLRDARDNPRARTLIERNAELEDELAALEERIARITDVLIPPEQMVRVLRELLDHNNLTLVRLNVQPVTRVRDAGEGATALYQHRLELDLTGHFDGLTAYLEAIEALPWQLFWDRMTIETRDYPRLDIRLRVHTLSGQEAWLNV